MADKEVHRGTAEEMLRLLHEHATHDGHIEQVAQLIHPQAEMRLLVASGRLLQGRQSVLEALQRAGDAGIYRGQVRGFEWLDERTVLTVGYARYALERGHAEGTVYWLDEFRDELIWRVRAFHREHDARRAYEERFEPPAT